MVHQALRGIWRLKHNKWIKDASFLLFFSSKKKSYHSKNKVLMTNDQSTPAGFHGLWSFQSSQCASQTKTVVPGRFDFFTTAAPNNRWLILWRASWLWSVITVFMRTHGTNKEDEPTPVCESSGFSHIGNRCDHVNVHMQTPVERHITGTRQRRETKK